MTKLDSARPARGRPAAFATSVFERYAGKLKRYLDRRLAVPQDAEDVAQEVYLQLLQIDAAKEIQNPLGFLYGVAGRVLADHVATLKRRGDLIPSAGEVSEIGLEAISQALADRIEECVDVQQQVARVLAALPPMQAAVLTAHHQHGMTHEEVAQKLGLSVHTVKKYVFKAHATVRLQAKAWKDLGE